MLLLNKKGNNRNSEESTELHVIITNAITTQLLEIFTNNKIKIFDAKECFSLSDQEMLDIHKDEH